MTIGLGRIEEASWDIVIADESFTGVQAHGLGFAPAANKISIKPKSGSDPAGETVTVTTDGTNITLTRLSDLGALTYEVQYVEGL